MIILLRNTICTLGVIFIIVFHVIIAFKEPPNKLPDLYWVINNAFCFGFFCLMSLYAHLLMFK
jgi:hypothetical protein